MSIIEIHGPWCNVEWRRQKLAVIIVSDTKPLHEGPHWFTDNNEALQVGVSWYKSGHEIRKHVHPPRERPSFNGQTQEVLALRKGKMLAHFWDTNDEYAGNWTISGGDTVVIFAGAHYFVALEDVELLEVKQGPFDAQLDKEYREHGTIPGT